jgi:hypothetical protein
MLSFENLTEFLKKWRVSAAATKCKVFKDKEATTTSLD